MNAVLGVGLGEVPRELGQERPEPQVVSGAVIADQLDAVLGQVEDPVLDLVADRARLQQREPAAVGDVPLRHHAPSGRARLPSRQRHCPVGKQLELRYQLRGPALEDNDTIREQVRERYTDAARRATDGTSAECCSTVEGKLTDTTGRAVFGGLIYDQADARDAPEAAVAASLGCGGTDEMLANANAAAAGAENVEFIKGHIEEIPLPDASLDVVISHCVINPAGDKAKVPAEAARVLKSGGASRFPTSSPTRT